MRKCKRAGLGLIALGTLTLSACTDLAGYDLDYFWGNFPFMAVLRGSVAYDPYELPRLPAPGTIPVASPIGDVPPPFTQLQLDSAGATLSNPFAGSAPPVVLARGAKVYENQCYACHGPAGAGDGPVVGPGKYPFAPAVNGAATAARSDGYIYGVIAIGRGLMPAYGERIQHLDRWAVVEYVRELQRQAGAGAPAEAVTPGVPTVVNPPDSVLPTGQPVGAVDTTRMDR